MSIDITTHRSYRIMAVILTIMIMSSSTILVYLPPLGPVIALLLIAISFFWTLYLFKIRIKLVDGIILVRGFFSTRKVVLEEVIKLKTMRVIGTVANAPLLVRSFTMETHYGEEIISTFWYPLKDVLELLEIIDDLREEETDLIGE